MGILSSLGSWFAPKTTYQQQSVVPRTPHPVTAEVARDGFLLPHYRTFNGITNVFSRVYSGRWDEAIRRFPADAQSMRNDCYLMSLLDERTLPLSRWKWQLVDEEGEVEEGQEDPEREKVRKQAEAIIRRTWKLNQMREYLREAVWFGRYGAQIAWEKENIGGYTRDVIGRHIPIHGDKIFTDFDGYDAVAIASAAIGATEYGDAVTFTDRMPVLRLRDPQWRQRFVIQRWRIRDGDFFDPFSAGQIGGIGLRHYLYWSWWLRDEMLSWATDFMEKVGSMGIAIFYFEEGNQASENAANKAASEVKNRSALAVGLPKGRDPKTAGVDFIPANMSGVQFLKEFIADYFEKHIERMIVGQTLSGGTEGSGLGGTGVAALHADTKFQLLASDAECFDAGYTEDIVRPVMELNFAGCPYKFRWKHILPDPDAEKKLSAAQTFIGMGGTLEEAEVRETTGFRQPRPEAKTLGGQQPGMGGDPAMMLPGGGGPEGDPEAAPGDDGDPMDDIEETPGMAELVAAMFQAADEGDMETVRQLAGLGQDAEEFEKLVGSGDVGVIGYAKDWEPPSGRRKSWRRQRDGGGYEYRATPPAERGTRETPQEKAKRFKAEREPGRQEARETWQRAAQNPGSIREDDLPELAEQISRLTRDEVREVVRGLGSRTGGLKRDLVERMLAHVRGGNGAAAGSGETAATPPATEQREEAPAAPQPPQASEQPAEPATQPKDAPAPKANDVDPWSVMILTPGELGKDSQWEPHSTYDTHQEAANVAAKLGGAIQITAGSKDKPTDNWSEWPSGLALPGFNVYVPKGKSPPKEAPAPKTEAKTTAAAAAPAAPTPDAIATLANEYAKPTTGDITSHLAALPKMSRDELTNLAGKVDLFGADKMQTKELAEKIGNQIKERRDAASRRQMVDRAPGPKPAAVQTAGIQDENAQFVKTPKPAERKPVADVDFSGSASDVIYGIYDRPSASNVTQERIDAATASLDKMPDSELHKLAERVDVFGTKKMSKSAAVAKIKQQIKERYATAKRREMIDRARPAPKSEKPEQFGL